MTTKRNTREAAAKTINASFRTDVSELMGKRVYSRDGKQWGTVIGFRPCTLDGCGGTRLCVRWIDSKLSWPCLKGMEFRDDGHLKIR